MVSYLRKDGANSSEGVNVVVVQGLSLAGCVFVLLVFPPSPASCNLSCTAVRSSDRPCPAGTGALQLAGVLVCWCLCVELTHAHILKHCSISQRL